ncbi:uncharacterized protein At4g26485-like [Rutidosis leptorrhynchoides]|uniref:uncharacterized protein At4g26485-like n=1 Tax=Rutidosis leptorrhynchoides TaxID=125765 RepID=UPI003A9A5E05
MWRYEEQTVWSKNEMKWVKHYNSENEILLVGEGDFSFGLSLATAFGSATNIVATSLDSYDDLIKKYNGAATNLLILHSYGAQLLHGVDATKMQFHPYLQNRKFDRIIYNFPHAGFIGLENDPQVIEIHRNLVRGFLKNASCMLRFNGEVHVTHKTTTPFDSWNIEELGTQSSLQLLECVKFNIQDYPGYNNKRGDGKRSDEPFPLRKCNTFKFVLSSNLHHQNPLQDQEITSQTTNARQVMNPVFQIFREYFDHARLTYGITDEYLLSNVRNMLAIGFERCKAEDGVDPLNDYINHLKEIQYMSKLRIANLRNSLLEVDQRYAL